MLAGNALLIKMQSLAVPGQSKQVKDQVAQHCLLSVLQESIQAVVEDPRESNRLAQSHMICENESETGARSSALSVTCREAAQMLATDPPCPGRESA